MAQKRFRRRHYQQPLIDPTALKHYLDKPRDDWRWIKQVPREELEAIAREANFSFHTKPRLHQLACWTLCMKIKRFLLLLDMGSGKSKIALDLIRYAKAQKPTRALVCVPNNINLPSWEDQIKAHAPDLSFVSLQGTRAKRYDLLDKVVQDKTDVCLINYAGLQTYLASARKVSRGKTKRALVAEDLQDFASLFNFLVLDEPHLVLSSVRSTSYELLKYLSWRMEWCFGLTGTLFGRNPSKVFPQFHVVDSGATLGHSFGMFQSAFFTAKADHFKGLSYTFDNTKRKRLNQILQNRSIRYEDKEFTDLPQLMPSRVISVTLTPSQLNRYGEMLQMAASAREKGEHHATWIRLRQTAAGFISAKPVEEPAVVVNFIPNPKAQALEQFLLELPDDEKVVIFHDYLPSGKIIKGVLDRMKIGYAGVGGNFKDPREGRERFMGQPSCRVWVANCKAGGTGTDGLQKVARYILFYESPSSPDVRRQAIKRLHRDGQQRRVYVSDLVANNVGIDKQILASLAQGQDLFEAVCNGKEKLS